ncbi:MAG: glycoside hydrolase family 3 C-terminal domain-containing protein [Acholeplasmataceae bacterium]|jgi:beta-glucosidase|nr:glycoside hydrolase family 3 C-terminal domain-containing protein [Acholeplasmataceae bacterium]
MNYSHIIERMTLDEKAGLMSGKNFWETQDFIKYHIPSMFLADGPNGLRKQKASADHLGLNESIKSTCFPTPSALANTWNPHMVETIGTLIGVEALAENVGVVLGPGVNIKRNPLAGRNFEYFSEDPYLAGKLSASFIKGIQQNGIAASVKHFAANNQEYRRMSIDSVVDERALREIYLTPFEIAVKEGNTKTVMASYNLVNGIYANENTHLLRDILRNEWGFDGVVVSDWGGVNDRVKALIASSELEMPTSGGQTDLEIVKAVQEGSLDVSVLDQAVDRLLTLVFDVTKGMSVQQSSFDKELHHRLAEKAAEEAIVLLKNEDDILPINHQKKVAVIGDFARELRFQGAGSSGVNPTKLDSVLNHLKDTHLNVIGYEQGFHRYGKSRKNLTNRAVKLAKNADVILLFLGLDEFSETEGLDRENIYLPKNQLELIEHIAHVNQNIVVVLSCGSVVDMTFDYHVKGLLHGYLLGQAGANALLKVITGEVNPSGKLSETHPVSYFDVPSQAYFPGTENTVEYRESLFVGYRYYDTANVPVKYPFGFGLSYTSFHYDQLQIDLNGISFNLTNTGMVSGMEIVQLYVGNNNSLLMRPKKELKGFKKIYLESGETKNVQIPFDEYSFRVFDVITNTFKVESGEYSLYIGSSVQHIQLQGNIIIEGERVLAPNELEQIKDHLLLNIHQISDQDYKRILGHEIPTCSFYFYKKNRMRVDYNTTVQQLRYAPGWSGRFFAWSIRSGYHIMRFIGKKKAANIVQMALYHNPMRNISRLTGGLITWLQLDGMILMFNGKFFKGLHKFIKAGMKKNRIQKGNGTWNNIKNHNNK